LGLLDYFKFNKRSSNFLAGANLYGSNSGIGVSEKTSIALTAVWSAIRLLSETIASLPLNVYRMDKDGSKFIDYDNPLNKLISIAPSPNYTSYNFIETMMTHLLLYGNAYAVIIRNGGARPIELKICDPESVEPIKSQDDGLVYYKTKSGMYSSKEILHIVGFSYDGIKGKSPIQACQQALSIGMASQQFGSNFFGRGANLAGVLEHPARLSDDAANRLRESFAQRFSGINNSHKTAVLEEGVKFKPIGLPLADLQYIETRRFSTEEVARLYRVPLHLLQDLSKSSFNNIEQQSLEFAKYSLMPYLRNWESELYRKLLADREQSTHFFKFNTKELLRSDANSRADYYRKMFEIGALSPNEIRNLEDMNKIQNGNDHYVPLNLSDIDNINNKQNDE
jgi:HK97 family phage portal protein